MAKKEAKKTGLTFKKLIPGIIAVVIVAAVLSLNIFKQESAAIEFQKGTGYCTWSQEGYLSAYSDESITKVEHLGNNYISILVTWYQTTPWSNDIQRTIKTPSDESVIHAIRKAHELGMKVMLKLHLDLLDKSDGSWRGEIGSIKEEGWEAWFREYTKYVMYYADLAKKEKVEILCVGTELSTTATTKGYMWVDLIKKVKSAYPGRTTYAAHWDVYQDIRFWKELDYVGINAYFPLTEKMSPTYEELKEGWTKWVKEMEEFQSSIGMPIIFPEIGCASADGAAIRPWEHMQRSEVNLELQEDYYKVLVEIFWDKEWFYGLYWWYWGTNVKMGGKYNRGFTPQNKPAQNIISLWYAKSAPR